MAKKRIGKKKSKSRVGTEPRRVSVPVRQLVLHEAGYKCANPCCRHPLTLDIHHLLYVSEEGGPAADNLLPLCPNCHRLHHRGEIPGESLRAWKMLLLALNEAFDRRSIDLLLVIAELGKIDWITGDGLPHFAALAASNLIAVGETSYSTKSSSGFTQHLYKAELTNKGKLFVEGWKKGDQKAAIALQDTVGSAN